MALTSDLTISINGDVKGLKDAYKQASDQTKALSDTLGTLAKAATASFAAASAASGLALKAFADFDDQIRGTRTLLDETSFAGKSVEEGFKTMRQELLQLGATSGQEFGALNQALFDTVSAGVDAAGAVKVVGVSAKLAVAGLTDVSVATDGMTSAMNAYGIAAKDADKVASKFFTAQKFGKTTIESLARGFGLVGANAQAAGVSLDELLGAVSAVTTAGVKTNAAYTGLKAVLANIAIPTKQATDEAKRLGIEFNLQALRAKGLEKFLYDLTHANGFTKDSVTQLFGSVEAQTVAFALTGQQASAFTKTVRELGDETKAVATLTDAYNVQSASLSRQMNRLKGSVMAVAIQIGEHLAPIAEQAIGFFQKLIDTVSQDKEFFKLAAQALALTVALSGAVAVAATGGIAFLKMRAAIIALSGSVKILSLSVKGLVGATGIGLIFVILSELEINWTSVFQTMQAVFKAFVNNISTLGQGLKTILLGIVTLDGDAIRNGLTEAKQAFQEGLQEFETIREEQKARELESDRAQGEAKREVAMEQFEANRELDLEQKAVVAEDLSEHEKQLKEIKDETRNAAILSRQQDELDEAKRVRDDRIQFEKDTEKHGRQIAQIKQLFRSSEYQQVKGFFGEMQVLTQSNNKTLFEIGKVAATASAIVNTAEGVTRALAAYPPPFAQVAAAAQAAAGAAQIATIGAQTLAEGGIVTGGIPGRDSVPALLTPGEFVAPVETAQQVIDAAARDKVSAEEGPSGGQEITVRIEPPELAEIVEVEIGRRQSDGTSRLPDLGVGAA